MSDTSNYSSTNISGAIKTLRSAVNQLGPADREHFTKQLVHIESRSHKGLPVDKKLVQIVDKVHALSAALVARTQAIPEISFPENLPVSAKREEISDAIQSNQVVIVAGETGSGKTTQIPKICLELGFGIKGKIGHTQPRRIAARTVASRIAEELNVNLGSLVGYQVRFTDHSDETTAIKLMTDGILLAEIQHDPLLLKYDVIIIDEAHERSLNIDFILGYLKRILAQRPSLKVIVTSATIDVDRFSAHFDNAPVIEVSGRTFPVEVRYRPWHEDAEEITDAILDTCSEIVSETRGKGGDILIFLSGEREIREVSHALKKADMAGCTILPLYARLGLAEQNKVFQPNKYRKIVLATNVAETSITVPGIKYVIDTGFARISRYSLRTKVQRLPIEAISQASANQRKGRCGRVSDGICYRLYSEEDFEGRPEFTDPELLRTNLAAVVLQMLHLKMGRVEDFPFVDKPDNRLINDGYALLEELTAVSKKGQLTQLGRNLQRLSVDPRLGRMVLEAAKNACLNEALIIVSALTIQDPRERPAEKQQAADEQHRRFKDEDSDFIAFVNLWNYVEGQRQELSQSQLRKLCKKEFLNFMRLKEWRELHHQLKLQCKDLKLTLNSDAASSTRVHQSLLVGLLSNIGKRNDEERDYLGTRSRKFMIFPGSSLRKKKMAWMMAADFIETSQLYAHCVAKVDPAWILNSAQHLIKNTYFEPHYDSKSGSVKCFVKIALWGLVITEKKRVDYSRIEPELCREIFIRSALVENKYKGKGSFFKRNAQLISDITHLEAKARRRDILVDDEQVFQFYNDRIPEDILNLAGFEHWRKEIETREPGLLLMSSEQLMLHDANQISEDQFPETLRNGDLAFPVKYEFEPTKQNDGVNVLVPVDLLHQVNAAQLEWLVPGLLKEKCIALVKTLPKQKRKNLVPVPNFVDRALARMTPSTRPLLDALAEQLQFLAKVDIQEDDWQAEKLDTFYLVNIVLLDHNSQVIDQSRDLAQLRAQYKEHVQATLQNIGSEVEREGLTTWDFEHFPRSVELSRGAVKVKAFPALVADVKQKTADVKLFDSPKEAEIENVKGLCLLALNELGQTAKYARKDLLRGKDIGLTVVDLGSREDVADDILLASVRRACFPDQLVPIIEDKSRFLHQVGLGKSEVFSYAQEYEKILLDCLKKVLEARKRIKTSKNALALALAFGDIQHQVNTLFTRGFLFNMPWLWVQQLPRYLDAILVRMEKAPQKLQADRVGMYQIQALWQQHEDRLNRLGQAEYLSSETWIEYRWMLEELRVSLFAQTLKTRVPVSEKRLKKLWSSL